MRKLKAIFVLLFVHMFLAQHGNAQNKIAKSSCPLSLITHALGDSLENRFKIVFKNFPSIIHYNPIPFLCEKREINKLFDDLTQDNLVNGIRIYFGQDKNDSLSFVFTGTKDTFDITPLYIYNTTTSKFTPIKKHVLNDLTNSFYLKTIQRFDFGLEDGNTTSYFFGESQLKEIKKVFQDQIGRNEIEYIGIQLGAYVCGTALKCPLNVDLTNRLMLVFSFFNSKKTEVYLEDNYCSEQSRNKATAGLDTGSPCPPKTNCP